MKGVATIMRSELISQEGNVVSIKLTFEAEEFVEGVNKAVKELSSKVSIAGFRKGHVPRKILEMRLGKRDIYAEAIEDMLPEAIGQVVDDYDLDLIDEPGISIGMMEEGSPVEVSLTFEVTPEVVLPEIAEIVVKRPVPSVDDDTVSRTVDEVRMQNATLSPVDEAAGEGHVVEIEYTTVVDREDGREEIHGPENATIDLGLDSVRQEIKEAILGARQDEPRSAMITVEDDYPDANVAGRAVKYMISIKTVHEKILPEMAPPFFEKVLSKGCETEQEFREEIKNRILEKITSDINARVEFDALQSIADLSTLTVPEILVRRQAAAMKREDEEHLKRSRGITLEEMLAEASSSMADYENNIRAQAEIMVRRSLVLDKVAEEKGIRVEKEDFEAEMQTLASSYNLDANRLMMGLFKDKKMIEEVANRIKYKKTMAEIMNMVQIDETEQAPEETPAE